jgi:hypothetical protein
VDNPLIGVPLAYQYLTTLRSDAAPLTADALLAVRGSGWLLAYPQSLGASARESGLPLVSALEWDTGVQVRVGSRPVQLAFAVTNGSLSHPTVRDDNHGKQFSTRLTLQPTAAIAVGVSASSGAYLAHSVTDPARLGESREYAQRALGADLEFARDAWLLRVELLASRWQMPRDVASGLPASVGAVASSVEARYRITPRVFVASRVDHLAFSSVSGSGGTSLPWDAPVTRLEGGGGLYLQRNLVAKVTYQRNWRDLVPARQTQGQVATQLAYWF